MKRVAFLTLFLLFSASQFAQDRIAKLTYSIVDTSKNQTAQVKSIYGWITQNIAYDVGQYEKVSNKYHTPEQVLHRRKALCQGYAELFSEMCRRIGVESYFINGYSKGFGYVKGTNFLKADHSWNICYADSTYLIIDATWGSGFLDYEYSTFSKIRIALTGSEGIRTKLKFVPKPTNDYFAILPEKAINTHFPLDSKWQLLPLAVPYRTFAFDSSLVDSPIDFEDMSYQTRVSNTNNNCFVDGVNSIRYNPYNHFDIAYQYQRQANTLTVVDESIFDTLKIPLVDTTIRYYERSLDYIKSFRTLRRDTYSDKRQQQGQIYRDANRTVRAMGRIPSTPNGKYPREEKRFLRMDKSLTKATHGAEAARKSYAMGVSYSFEPPSKRDTSTFANLRMQIAASITIYTEQVFIVENKLKDLVVIQGGDTLTNEGIIPHLDSATTCVLTIRQSLDDMNEFAFFRHCDTLNAIYSRYDTALVAKTKVKVNLAQSFGELSLSFSLAEMALKKILRHYERMAKKSGDNEHYSALATPIAKHLHQLYGYKREALGLMVRNNYSWQLLADKLDNEISVYGPNGLATINRRMELFYSFVSSRNTRVYDSDIDQTESIKDAARSNLSLAKEQQRALKKIQQASRKKKGKK
ncbi:transglutaminase domain-containing protein [Williamwhitmania taraxaci]|uniref:Transglutaminase-like superfamily protein n=1 Tax=Williamwhitmania taraxaci TaxID=1640674 RepID=A0A1G6IKV1_9BACT|nr:transglutaminase domain-containing protein [Williamwhitmania taraxaci]SDC07149.1 Transglutaminase-like superfamily protein [Williamwhitmania taraxaci]